MKLLLPLLGWRLILQILTFRVLGRGDWRGSQFALLTVTRCRHLLQVVMFRVWGKGNADYALHQQPSNELLYQSEFTDGPT